MASRLLKQVGFLETEMSNGVAAESAPNSGEEDYDERSLELLRETHMLDWIDAIKWVQIGACIAIGYYMVRWTGILLFAIFHS